MKRDDLLDLNDALQHPGREVTVDLSTELPEEEDLDLVTPLEGTLECVSTGNLLLVKGEFKGRCMMDCSRCGGPIEVEIDYAMDEEFAVEGTPSTYGADDYARIATQEEPYPMFDGNQLIVENLIRQGLWLNMPMQPICEHGWEGDCPQAAEMDAVIRAKEETSRFEMLAKLKAEEEA